MDVADILRPGSIRREEDVRSKKHALELLSELLGNRHDELKAADILVELVKREQLGSTGLGHSIAMPHARMNGIGETIGAFLKLGVLVPQDCSDEQIRELKELIQRLQDSALQTQLRETTDPAEMYDLLTDSLTVIHRRLKT